MTGKLSALIRKSNPGGDAKLESLLRLFESQVLAAWGPATRGGQLPAGCSLLARGLALPRAGAY
jgi:hypothetical protein